MEYRPNAFELLSRAAYDPARRRYTLADGRVLDADVLMRMSDTELTDWVLGPPSTAQAPGPPAPPSRPTWEETFFALARTWAARATCPRLSVGCVLVNSDHQVIASGYNGAARGEPHCTDAGCRIAGGHCVRAIHAELNALLQAARVGVSVRGTTLYVTHRPCVRCWVMLRQAGVEDVRWPEHAVYANDGWAAPGAAPGAQASDLLSSEQRPG